MGRTALSKDVELLVLRHAGERAARGHGCGGLPCGSCRTPSGAAAGRSRAPPLGRDADHGHPQLARVANSLLRHRVLFGSDFPVITPDRWLADFAELEFEDDVRPLILTDNAAHVLGLVG